MFRKTASPCLSRRMRLWLPATITIALLTACASIPPPTDAMRQAQVGLHAAATAGATDTDPVDLQFAQSKYQQAQTAMTAGKYALAADLARESRADSRLALTKARLATSRGQIGQQTQENARLRKQLQDRSTSDQGNTPAPTRPAAEELPQTVLPAPAASSAMPATGQPVQEGL